MSRASDARRLISQIELPDPGATLSWREPLWCQEAPRLLVERTVESRWWPWLDESRGEVGATLFAVSLAVMLWWFVRTLRRPREIGHLHCRRCNHRLLDGARAAERCPECGSLLGPGQVAVGRRRSLRFASVMLPALVFALCGVLMTRERVSLVPVLFPLGTPRAFPLAWLDSIPWWPLWRVPVRIPHICQIDAVDLAADGSMHHVGSVRMEGLTARNWIASRDGRVIARLRWDPDNAWDHELFWYELDTGLTRSTRIGRSADGFPWLCGFSPDGRSIVVRRDGPFDGPGSLPMEGDRPLHPATLLEVDMATSAVRTIATSEARAHLSPGPTPTRTVPRGLGAAGAGPRFRWAMLSIGVERPGPALEQLIVGGAEGVRAVKLGLHDWLDQNKLGDLSAIIEDDRWLVIDGRPWQPILSGRPRLLIDLENGNVQYRDLEYFTPWNSTPGPMGIASTIDIQVHTGRRWAVVDARPSIPGQSPQPIPGTPVKTFALQLWSW